MIDVIRALRQLEEIEAAKAEFYERSGEGCNDEEGSALFGRLHLDQLSRRNVIQYQTRIAVKNAGVFRSLSLPVSLLGTLHESVASLRQAETPPTLNEAVETAVELEARTLVLYGQPFFEALAKHFGPFVATLRSGSQRHLDLLAKLRSSLATAVPARPAETVVAAPLVELPVVDPHPRAAVVSPSGLADILERTGNSMLPQLLDALCEGAYIVDRERKILYWNRAAEQIAGFDAAEQLGRHCWNDRLNHVKDDGGASCGAECPLHAAMEVGCAREQQLFLHHKDGHRLPVNVVVQPIKDGSGTVFGAVELFRDSYASQVSREKLADLEKMAYLDALTGLANRRYLEATLLTRLSELQRHGWPFGVAFVDIDNFKAVNDAHGHLAGDRLLRMVAATLAANVRLTDLVGRWGGDEFLAILSNVDQAQLAHAADKLRVLVQASAGRDEDRTMAATVSIGGTLARPEDTIETLVDRVDQLMLGSKREGRFRVSLADERQAGTLDVAL